MTMCHGNSSDSISVAQFNSGYNSGRTYGGFVENDLNNIIENNKTNNKKIAVKYGEKETNNPDEIIEIKKSLDLSIYYEITLNYDDGGYINIYSIEIAAKTSEELKHESDTFNLHYKEGTINGFFIQSALDTVILSNEKNADKQIVVKYNDIESKEESDIEQIKSKLGTHIDYRVRLKYDEEGFVNQYNIEDK